MRYRQCFHTRIHIHAPTPTKAMYIGSLVPVRHMRTCSCGSRRPIRAWDTIHIVYRHGTPPTKK